MRIPNKYIKRNRYGQEPIIEVFTYHLRGCKVFYEMDLKAGYHQLSINVETRNLALFSTPWGNYRPKRLIFGVKSSQKYIRLSNVPVFGDIPLCINQRDDKILGGKREEHNRTLEKVLPRAKEYRVKFNQRRVNLIKQESHLSVIYLHQKGKNQTQGRLKMYKTAMKRNSKKKI